MPTTPQRGRGRTQTAERPAQAPAANANVEQQLNEQPTKSTALARLEVIPQATLAEYRRAGYDQMRLAMVWQQCARDLNLGELIYFMERCIRTGLDPLRKQIYAIKRKDRRSPTGFTVAHQTGIDGFRAIAQKSGAYAGSDAPVFLEPFEHHGKQIHEICRVTVYKVVQGVRVGFTGECRFSEYYPTAESGRAMWDQYGHNQLAKCTEAQALRKGFPIELGEFEIYGELGTARDDQALVIDQVADRGTPRAANVRALDEGDRDKNAAEYERLYGNAYADDPPLEQPRDDDGAPIVTTAGTVSDSSGNTVEPVSGEIVDGPDAPVSSTAASSAPAPDADGTPNFDPNRVPSADAKDAAQDDDVPPWEQPATPPARAAAAPSPKVAERAAQGLCTHPECIEANTPNKAAADTDPPRCLNHVGG